MKTPHHRHHQLLLSLAGLNCLIIFDALLLINAQQATGNEPGSCYASSTSSTSTCPGLSKNGTMIFPFLQSRQCGTNSSLVITSGCMWTTTNGRPRPQWPAFNNGTMTNGSNLNPPAVMGFFNPFNSNQTPRSRFDRGHGLINLTWDERLTNQSVCRTASLDQISQYIPNTIDLGSFAHSAFQFSPSNTILLFNCTPTSVNNSSFQNVLHRNTTACTSYRVHCNLQEKDYHCYQYRPSKNLSLQAAMKRSNCKQAMFFVVQNTTALINVSQWRPGLIQLNWSTTSKGWLNSTLSTCVGCLQTKGVCGYDLKDDFQCFCANNLSSASNCTATMMVVNTTSDESHTHTGGGCKGFRCGTIFKVIIGVAGFAIALSISVVFILFYIYKRRKVYMKANIPCSSPQNNKFWMKRPSFLSRKQDPICAKEISYEEIVRATESFADKHVLGDGGFGAVYQGVLADGRKVAVKRLHHDNYRRMEHFYNEIKALSNLNHPNLVKLFGFCCEDERELLLVFEYAQRGTVSDQLHNTSMPPMSWKLRLDIACDTADALSYLHNSANPPIYHRDVKTTNILLDEGFHAKLADFGLSKLVPLKVTHVSTAPQGTPGYLDPEYHQCYQLTDKSDVYSLGVVLMELISAKLAVDMSRDKGEINLSTLAVMKIKCGLLEELVDPALHMGQNPRVDRSIKRVVELAFQCLHAERDDRPSMSSVAETLSKIRRETAIDEAGDEEPLLAHTPTKTRSRSTQINRSNFVSDGPNKSHSSPPSVFFSSDSSYPSSNLSST